VAENESLDLGSSYGKRWTPALTAIRNGEPVEKVAPKFRKALIGEFSKALRDFQKEGVSLADLLAHRGSPSELRRLVHQTKSHAYALLFEQVARAQPASGTSGVLKDWLGAVLDKVFDQISVLVVEADGRCPVLSRGTCLAPARWTTGTRWNGSPRSWPDSGTNGKTSPMQSAEQASRGPVR
jgi:hypothetical protein